jgi:UDP-N-acetyl-D-mannosaminuronate dehydrogenase
MDITNIGRQKNRNQFKNTSQKIANVILKEQLRIKEINICFLGFSYKANVGIFKNSQIGYVINDLYYNFDLKKISIYDSYFTDKNIKSVDNIIKKDLNCPDIEIFTDINKLKQYDIVCLSINHDNLIINEKLLSKIIKPNGIYIDFYNRKIDNIPDNINYYPSSYPSNYLSWYNIDEI